MEEPLLRRGSKEGDEESRLAAAMAVPAAGFPSLLLLLHAHPDYLSPRTGEPRDRFIDSALRCRSSSISPPSRPSAVSRILLQSSTVFPAYQIGPARASGVHLSSSSSSSFPLSCLIAHLLFPFLPSRPGSIAVAHIHLLTPTSPPIRLSLPAPRRYNPDAPLVPSASSPSSYSSRAQSR